MQHSKVQAQAPNSKCCRTKHVLHSVPAATFHAPRRSTVFMPNHHVRLICPELVASDFHGHCRRRKSSIRNPSAAQCTAWNRKQLAWKAARPWLGYSYNTVFAKGTLVRGSRISCHVMHFHVRVCRCRLSQRKQEPVPALWLWSVQVYTVLWHVDWGQVKGRSRLLPLPNCYWAWPGFKYSVSLFCVNCELSIAGWRRNFGQSFKNMLFGIPVLSA